MDFTQLGTDIGNAINTITDIKDAILGIPDDIRNASMELLNSGHDMFSEMVTSAVELLRMSPDEWNSDGWSAISTVNTSFVILGCTFVIIFWCMKVIADNIDIRQTMRPETMIKEGVILVIAEWFVCNSFTIFSSLFGLVDYLTSTITTGDISPSTPDAVSDYLTTSSLGTAIVNLLPTLVYVAIMVFTGAQILYFSYVRFFKVMLIAPYGSLVTSTIAGPNSISHSAVGFFKYALSTILEAATIILAVRLGSALYSSSIIGLPGVPDTINSLGTYFRWVVHECIISFVIVGAVKEAPVITQRALGA